MDLDTAEKLICERYNVPALPGPFAEAMTLARGGDASALRELVADRELYRWREAIEAALAEDQAVSVSVPFVQVGDVGNGPNASATTTVSSGNDTVIAVTNDEKPALEETPSKRSRK